MDHRKRGLLPEVGGLPPNAELEGEDELWEVLEIFGSRSVWGYEGSAC